MPEVGKAIIYVDAYGKERAAIVTHVGMPGKADTWINVAVVSTDEKQTDSYGLKIERHTSVGCWREGWTGNYWKE